jgi:hypothetical protein
VLRGIPEAFSRSMIVSDRIMSDDDTGHGHRQAIGRTDGV